MAIIVGDNTNNTLAGGAEDDLIQGLGGNDQLRGNGGKDTIEGGDGADVMSDGSGADRLFGASGDDYIFAAAGFDDLYNGGGGRDGIDYSAAAAAVTVRLSIAEAQDTGGAGLDTLVSIEDLSGSGYDDTLIGNAAANVITGEIGNDWAEGLDGNDRLNQSQSGYGVGNDSLFGGAGDDTIFSGAGHDQIFGGEGRDTVIFWSSFTGFPPPIDPGRTVNLQSGGPQFIGSGHQVTMSEVEELQGGSGGDDFIGSFRAETLRGLGGDDQLDGDGGDDLLDGGSADDLLDGGSLDDLVLGGAGNDTLMGDSGEDTLNGGIGNDSLDGGQNFDFVSFAGATSAIFVTLASTSPQQTQQGSDTFVSVEGLIGAGFGDAFSGGDAAEMFVGLGGNDSFAGGEGADTLQGGAGKDLLIGGDDKDVLTGGSGIDTFKFLSRFESTAAAPDRITDLQDGDIIDLSGIDANTTPGNQAFVLVDEHTGPGQAVLSYNAETDRTTLSLYTNVGDTVDGLITMNGDHTGHDSFVL